ncbi:hypothetical protein BD410DRAFT_766948 [Rickenella mellea]|uniref:Carboxylase:pyruvate/acetyl-coa/propionyl-CoA n=1 Tax=Rickenella mellea TaxID=50990 RepID=A0A4Y7QBP1_9AGAM|nr:hypothetical protein BD410DRAFT_766948 [Rickenella mellea]
MRPRVLVANRGEKLEWETIAIYTEDDASHATYADMAFTLEEPEVYMNVDEIVNLARRDTQDSRDHLHPGYGFLSESAELSDKLALSSPPIVFIGPSSETLKIAGDKMRSRQLAASLHVPISPGKHLHSESDVQSFCEDYGYPIMLKALDGGGGRGIRLVESSKGIAEAYKRRCKGESPSKEIFVEKAMIGGDWRHIEVQILGDETGKVIHLWERDCSVQRRFQKIIEIAPSRLPLEVVQPVLKSSLRIARNLKYRGLGTFEYLLNKHTGEWIFIEINPRLQVEHTVTEQITGLDLVRIQLSLFHSSTTLASLGLTNPPAKRGYAVQLRLTAEDPSSNFQLFAGHITSLSLPAGHGVRVDTWLSSGRGEINEYTVTSFFDSMLAKIIVSGNTFEDMNRTAKRALSEVHITGNVKTNVDVLIGVLMAADWRDGRIDTLWLERNLAVVLTLGSQNISERAIHSDRRKIGHSTIPFSCQNLLVEPGSTFNVEISPIDVSRAPSQVGPSKHVIHLSSISHNSFPSHLSGTLTTSLSSLPLQFSLQQSTSGSTASSQMEFADPHNDRHIRLPLTGKLIELHPALVSTEGTSIKKGDILAVVSLMNMENTVLAPEGGRVKRTGRGLKVGLVAREGTGRRSKFKGETVTVMRRVVISLLAQALVKMNPRAVERQTEKFLMPIPASILCYECIATPPFPRATCS